MVESQYIIEHHKKSDKIMSWEIILPCQKIIKFV